MTRHLSWFAGALLAACFAIQAYAAEAPQMHLKGLWLTTDYPSVAARAGDSTTLKLKLQNYGLPPERVALSVDGVPAGWKAVVLGGGAPVTAAMPATDDNVQLQLRVDVPAGVPTGSQTLTVRAKAPAPAMAAGGTRPRMRIFRTSPRLALPLHRCSNRENPINAQSSNAPTKTMPTSRACRFSRD